MKQFLKSVVQRSVAGIAPAAWRLRREPSLLVLMYHRVLPAAHPARATEQPGMYVSPQTLDMHLGVLREYFSLLHLDDWLHAVQAGKSVPANACAITFDDGWRDNYDHAFPILKRHAVPATVYLVSDLIGTKYSFWPNTLAAVLAQPHGVRQLPEWLQQLARANGTDGDVLGVAQIDAVIDRCKARSDTEMLTALQSVAVDSTAERDLMSWDEIGQWHSDGLIRFGSHTRRHRRLTRLDSPDQVRDEIIGSRQIIAERMGTVPATFCYPNGDFSPPVVDVVRDNFAGAVTTARGWNRKTADPHMLNRVGVHEDVAATRTSFVARLAGVG